MENKILWSLIIFLLIGLIFENSARMTMQDNIQEQIEEMQRSNQIQGLINDIKTASWKNISTSITR